MNAGLRLFEIELPVIGALAVWRDFAEAVFPYRLDVVATFGCSRSAMPQALATAPSA